MTASNFHNIYDLDQGIARTLAEGLTARIFPGENLMFSIVRIEPHAEGSMHSHPEEQWGIMLEGSGVRTQDGVEHAVKAGDFWRTPGNIVHGLKAGPEGCFVIDVFSPPRGDYKNAGSGYGNS